jgi:DNA polymerase epsilon subunit 4
VSPANAVLHHDNLEFLEDVIPKTTSYSKVKDQAAATRAKLQGDKKAGGAGVVGEEPPAAGLPNGKKHKTNGHANGVAAQKMVADDDPSAQLEMEMRQAQRGHDGDVDMTG